MCTREKNCMYSLREQEIASAMSGAVKAVLLSQDLIPDVAAPSQIYIEESCRETGTVTGMRYA